MRGTNQTADSHNIKFWDLEHRVKSVDSVDAVVAHMAGTYTVMPFDSEEMPGIYLLGDDELKVEIRNTIQAFMERPLDGESPYPDSDLLNAAIRRSQLEANARLRLYGQLGATPKIEQLTEKTTLFEEKFVQTVYEMRCVGNEYTGTINNIEINGKPLKARFKVAIDRQGTEYNVTISGKPAAMQDEPLRVLPELCFSYDVTKSVTDQLGNDTYYMQELLTILKGLKKPLN